MNKLRLQSFSLLFVGLSYSIVLGIDASPMQAATFTESSDVGELIGTAQWLDAGVDKIKGTFWAKDGYSSGSYYNGMLNDRADLYRFTWGGGDFSAETKDRRFSLNGVDYELDLDTQLFLYRIGTEKQNGKTVFPLGLGLASNDDLGNVWKKGSNKYSFGSHQSKKNNSKLNLFLNPGHYYLGISTAFYDPIDTNGVEIFEDYPLTNQHSAKSGTTTLAGYGGTYFNKGTIDGGYTIHLSATSSLSQAPEPATILGSLLAGSVGILLKKRKKRQTSV